MLAFDNKLEELKREKREQQQELRKLYSKWNELRSERECSHSGVRFESYTFVLRRETESKEGIEAGPDPLKLLLQTLRRNLADVDE